MVELNLGFRSVAFLFLTSTCFPSLVQSICYIGCDLEFGSFEQKVDHTLSFDYEKTGTPLITQDWIHRLNSSGFDALDSKPVLNNAPKEKVSPTIPPTPMVDRGFYDLLISARASASFNFSRQKHEYPMVRVLQSKYVDFSSSYSEAGGVPAGELTVADVNGNNPPLNTCSGTLGLSREAIVGITVVVVVVVLFLSGCLYIGVSRYKNAEISSALLKNAHVQLMSAQAPSGSLIRGSELSGVLAGGLASITLDKAVQFSYEELSKATNDFSLGNKIGQGGFSAVYYAEVRGEKAAIKKMDMQASKEFLSELRVLTHVHHLNLVRLIGYCVQSSLFLVYEYIENGNLSQHLHGSGRDPLPWSIRVQIALDSARGLEYIHEYTASVFIHCDIKSTNILVDKNFNGKVADFGITKLTGVGSISRLGGTFGYMPPEYVQYGEVSPKVDVFAFGVVLYELISAKQAIIRANDPDDEPKSLVALFEEVLSQADPKDDLVKTIDPRLGDNYPLDSVHKMAQLAKTCTHEDPKQRPSMRSIVVALMTLSS